MAHLRSSTEHPAKTLADAGSLKCCCLARASFRKTAGNGNNWRMRHNWIYIVFSWFVWEQNIAIKGWQFCFLSFTLILSLIWMIRFAPQETWKFWTHLHLIGLYLGHERKTSGVGLQMWVDPYRPESSKISLEGPNNQSGVHHQPQTSAAVKLEQTDTHTRRVNLLPAAKTEMLLCQSHDGFQRPAVEHASLSRDFIAQSKGIILLFGKEEFPPGLKRGLLSNLMLLLMFNA